MADYHAILKRAISALPSPNGEMRRAVYEKARTALVNQLKSFDPPLTPSEITQQRLQLEEAIRKVESEAAKGLLKPATPPAPPPPVRPPEAVEPPPPAPAEPHPAEEVVAVPPEPVREPPQQAPLGTPAPLGGAAPPQGSALKQVVDEAGQLGGAAAQLGRATRDVLGETPETPPEPAAPAFAREDAEPPRKREASERKKRRERVVHGEREHSRLPIAVGLMVAVVVFAIGVVALWTQRQAISAFFGGNGEPVIDLAKRGGEKLAPKATDRLASDDSAAKTTPAKPVATQAITATPQLQSPDAAASAGAATPPADPSAPPPQQVVPPVAQKAILYEEGKAGAQALITPGKVVWQLVPDPTASKPGSMMLRIRAEIPDRKMVVNIAMRPNADTSFPASHLIEIKFDLPPDFDGKSVSNVPGFILKGTEQARGDPLIAASAKVADNLFWIALGAADTEKTRNFKLLKEKGWIDVPLLYENGRRAILTIEKSGAGDQVVTDAFSAWGVGD